MFAGQKISIELPRNPLAHPLTSWLFVGRAARGCTASVSDVKIRIISRIFDGLVIEIRKDDDGVGALEDSKVDLSNENSYVK